MSESKNTSEKDFLWMNISTLPYFRGLLRAVEARVYQEYDLPSPMLDLGCGDGNFATIAFDGRVDVGLDPWTGPLHKAVKTGKYGVVTQGIGSEMPFEDATFASAVSNSVLEHIPDVDAVLCDLARVLKPGAIFLFCVPNHQFLPNLSVAQFFDRIHLKGLASAYRAFFNRISRHHHCDSPEVWKERLDKAGFTIEKSWHYFSPGAFHTLEWGHYFGLPSLIWHALFRKWILVPTRWNMILTQKIVQKYYDEPREQPQGAYSFYVARRNG